jgi:5-formyltetrahydrofolate cyclo-ligase
LEENNEKSSLRKLLLGRRDNLSADFMKIASKQIQKNLKKIEAYREAQTIASYYSIGSEVRTQDIMQEIISNGKTLALPKVDGDELVFYNVKKFEDLEKGEFGIMEPKENCPVVDKFDIILVPAVAMTRAGLRLGYGRGFYDRFLSDKNITSVALTYSKLVVKHIPKSNNDVPIHWVVTEDDVIKTS